jgi:polyketide synthase PksN
MVEFLEKRERPVSGDSNVVELIEKEILKAASQIIDVAEVDINKDMFFTEYGFDMIQLSLLHEEINKTYGIQSKAGIFSESASVEGAASELYDSYKDALDTHYQAVSSQPSAVSHQLSAFSGQPSAFSSQQSDFSLADMVYTLQVGREDMEQRLAFVVQDKDELVSGLKDYCEGKEVENLYTGNVKKDKAKSEFLLEGKEGREFIRIIIEEKKLSKLAWIWTSGVEIDWNLLYSEEKPRRISLPTYPFAKERYWVSSVESSQQSVHSSQLTVDNYRLPVVGGYGEKLHPLVHRNTSTLQEEKFTSYFTGKEFFLADHVVAGKKVLPGVAYIKMARAASELAGLENIKSIKNVVWMQPVVVEENHIQEVNISLYPNEDIIKYEVFISGAGGQRLVCSQGTFFVGAGLVPARINIDEIKNRCTKTKDKKEVYASFKEVGLEYGASFQAIQKLYYNENEAITYLKLPAYLKDDFKEFTLHPSLMDSALQTIIGFMQGSESPELLLPFSLGSVEIINPLTDKCFAYVKTRKTGAVQTFDIRIVDLSGNVLVNMNEFSVHVYHDATELDIVTHHKYDYIADLFQKLENGEESRDEVHQYINAINMMSDNQ